MEYFSKLNVKLDQGYKLTNTNCPLCNRIIIYHIENQEFFCVQCDLPVKLDSEIVQQSSYGYDDDEENEIILGSEIEKPAQQITQQNVPKQYTTAQNKKTSNLSYDEGFQWQPQAPKKNDNSSRTSAKMGQKLLQGWCMLEQTCDVCYTPIMRSKMQEYVCVTCDWSKVIKANDEDGIRTIGKPPNKIIVQESPVQQTPVKEVVQQKQQAQEIQVQQKVDTNQQQAPVQTNQIQTHFKEEQGGYKTGQIFNSLPNQNQQSYMTNQKCQQQNNNKLIQKLYCHYEDRLEKLIQQQDNKQIDLLLMNEITRLVELDSKLKQN